MLFRVRQVRRPERLHTAGGGLSLCGRFEAPGSSRVYAVATGQTSPLDALNRCVPLHDKVHAIHRVIAERLGGIDRVAAALYDPRSDLVKTFLDSAQTEDSSLRHYQARLSDSAALTEILH